MHKIEIDVELCRFLDNICVENAAGMYFACADEYNLLGSGRGGV